ncbi:MAG: XRE family transcriptional regulator [Rhodocyclales bacterium]|nr:XRE family transcriptional regulator [Rhodocyclales bacterium]
MDGKPPATLNAQAEQESLNQNSAQAESMKLRSELMSALKQYIVNAHLTQSQAAKVFGVTQPRISDLTRDKVDLFGLDALVNMAATAGLHVEMHVRRTA